MPTCNRCNDGIEYELFQDSMEHWKIGIKMDVNVYREHICKPISKGPSKYWCFDCSAAIPFRNPCIHRRQKLNPQVKVGYF